jgi:hypothetical protein
MILSPLRQSFAWPKFFVFFCAGLGASVSSMAAVSTVWNYQLKFDSANGFGSVPAPADLEGRSGATKLNGTGTWGGQSTRHYDVVSKTGSTYAGGPDGTQDLTITTRVMSNTSASSTNTWGRMNATIDSNNGLGVNAMMQSGKSRPNDWGFVAYTVTFSPDLKLTANDLSMRLSNVNGDGEIYEWAMVTLGTADQAPFASLDTSGNLITRIGDYKNTDYSDFTNSSYYNTDGSIKAGGIATGNALPTNKTMTQFLAGQPAGSGEYLNPDGSLKNRGTHIVGDGWVALDNFMTRVSDSPPSNSNTAPPINPRNYPSNYDDEVDITGALLGMDPLETVNSFTIWLGYNDVGTAGTNGFTRTDSDMFSYVSGIQIGGSVPEPSAVGLSLLAGWALCFRRRRC